MGSPTEASFRMAEPMPACASNSLSCVISMRLGELRIRFIKFSGQFFRPALTLDQTRFLVEQHLCHLTPHLRSDGISPMNIKGKVAIVTGSSRGVGRAT